ALHAYMNWGSDVPLVGASGAIAGLMGAYTVIYGADSKIKTLLFFGFKPFVFHIPAALYGLAWFAYQVWSARQDMDNGGGGIAWWAHVGGFALGAITAFVVRSDTDRVLVTDRSGELTFRHKNEELPDNYCVIDGDVYEYAENDVAGDGSELPEECPYCGTDLDEKHHITPGVAKCPGAACGRFVYPAAMV
ncbi:MAG: rhomboid family intramembrane serine protease, partial [Planctomycetota bacterium]